MQRKQMHAGRLSPAASDRLSRIDRIYTLATEVLGSGEKAAQWLKRPSRALAKELNCARSSTASSTDAVVMEVVPGPHGPGLDGIGGTFADGRWHSRGDLVVYFGGSAAITVLERLAHTDPDLLPDDSPAGPVRFCRTGCGIQRRGVRRASGGLDRG